MVTLPAHKAAGGRIPNLLRLGRADLQERNPVGSKRLCGAEPAAAATRSRPSGPPSSARTGSKLAAMGSVGTVAVGTYGRLASSRSVCRRRIECGTVGKVGDRKVDHVGDAVKHRVLGCQGQRVGRHVARAKSNVRRVAPPPRTPRRAQRRRRHSPSRRPRPATVPRRMAARARSACRAGGRGPARREAPSPAAE